MKKLLKLFIRRRRGESFKSYKERFNKTVDELLQSIAIAVLLVVLGVLFMITCLKSTPEHEWVAGPDGYPVCTVHGPECTGERP